MKQTKIKNSMIGLEIHGYIETKEKLFCNCKNFHDMKQIKPNINKKFWPKFIVKLYILDYKNIYIYYITYIGYVN